MQKIRELETVEVKEKAEKEVIHQKPIFLTPLNNLDHLKEGEHAHLECRVEPINDPNLKIEWCVLIYNIFLLLHFIKQNIIQHRSLYAISK